MRARPLVRWFGAWALLLCSAVAAQGRAPAGCADEEATPPLAAAADERQPARALAALVDGALARSRSVGAAAALAEATRRDTEEARAQGELQASFNLGVGPEATLAQGSATTRALQGRASLVASRLLWDGGRLQALVDWRSQMAEASRQAWLSQQEQIALGAVSLALERSRYRAQEQVYGQYVRKMSCLVDSLIAVVAADRGRASELLQARKALQQAELARVGTESQRRLAEIRLQRLAGDTDFDDQALGAALLPLPALETVLAAAEHSGEVGQLQSQLQAARRFAEAQALAARPQLSASLAGTRSSDWGGSLAAQHLSSLSAGITLSVPLLNPGVTQALEAARWRALAAREQLDDALESRRSRVREVHEQAVSSLDRAQRLRRVLGDSQQLRTATQLQWQQLGRRSLFDVMGAESEHYNLRISEINALIDAQQLNATLRSLGPGLAGAGADLRR